MAYSTTVDAAPGIRSVTRTTTWLRHADLTISRFAPLPLRLVLGISFLVHGLPKVFDRDFHQSFVGMLASLHVPAPAVMAWVVGLAEAIGGALLLLGALTALTSVVLIIDMVVAAVLVHAKGGFSATNIVGMGPSGPIFGVPGYELSLLYIGGLAALFLMGAGALSIDSEWERATLRTTPDPVPLPGREVAVTTTSTTRTVP